MFLSQANFGWLWSIFASFWFWLDKSLFGLIGGLYDILMAISRTAILSQAKIADIADRIEMLLGIFMLFKVGFSLITYIVNPDDFSDKSKGIGKLVTNTVISLALLVLVPYIFNIAYRVQAKILEENVLAQLIFGNKQKEVTDKNGKTVNVGYQYDVLTGGEKVQFEIMLPFLQPNVGVEGMEECSVLKDENGNFNDACFQALKDHIDDNNGSDLVNINNYRLGVEQGSFGLTFRLDTITTKMADNTDNYLFDYKWPITTIAGVIVCLLLISFCIDVAIRSIKLSFLQLIAPIPIISFMDPKSGKDGLFSKWYKMCFSTYISLFVRLLALFLGIFIITNLDQMVDVVSGTSVVNPIVKVFIIIGVLFFVKQLPKILQDLGIKLDGDGKFNLNPFKKMEEGMLGGKILKKPNELMGKAAKGIGLAPLHGMQTIGKKTIGGIDAARNGKGFRQGWDRTHGNLHNKFYKKLDEWAPDSAEARKNERLGREEVAQLHNKWTKGKQAADKLYDYAKKNGIKVKKPFDLLDGSQKNEGAYNQVYSNGEFIKSRMGIDKVDAKNKILQRISEQTSRGVKIKDALEAEENAINKLGAEEKNAFDEIKAYTTEAGQMAKFTEVLDSTSKQLSGMEKVHESIRKQNPGDAAVEDALKHVKYNPTDPTDQSRSTSGSWGTRGDKNQSVPQPESAPQSTRRSSDLPSNAYSTNYDENTSGWD